jgi:hypothetical protein
MLGGTAVTVGLPFLNIFLNDHGTALANGQPLPVRFGSWFWALGMNAAQFIPKKVGADYDLPDQIKAWEPVKKHINVYTKFNITTDGKPELCHFSGWVALRCGAAPASRSDMHAPSIDVLIADLIGGATRFRSLDVAATGNPRHSYSFRSGDAINASIGSPVELYTRVFGPEFQDPNSPDFTPRPELMMRKSVLSAVAEQSASWQRRLGAEDRQKLDQYFTSLRDLEGRLDLQTQKPPPAPSCKVAKKPSQEPLFGTDTQVVAERHAVMSDTIAMALACNQTKVFNIAYAGTDGLSKTGLDKTHHTLTHEETLDPITGVQPTCGWFVLQAMDAFANLVTSLASISEGAGTLLDNTVVYAHSDQELAKTHAMRGIPLMTAGSAGGRLKTGIHVDGKGDSGTRVGYTVMKTMGLNIDEWGEGSLKTSREVGEIVA